MLSCMYRYLIGVILLTCFSFVTTENVTFRFRTNSSDDLLNDVNIEVDHTSSFLLEVRHNFTVTPNLTFVFEEDDKNTTTSKKVSFTVSESWYSDNKTTWLLTATGTDPGHCTLVLSKVFNMTEEDNTTNYQFQIYHSQPLNVLSQVIGWFYFVAWSVSFYPQVILNFQRKSVVGLNFDFTGLNLAGFLCYTAYNVGLFWIPTVKKEYIEANPHDILPVEVNDVVFAIHAVVLTLVTIIQIIIYERGGQKMSMVARGILVLCGLAVLIFIIIAAVPSVPSFNWLKMVYAVSYVKLGITIIKYIPQAWMNFRRKSTVGWSIGNVLLDFTGGSCSVIQMFILAYNFDDWESIFLNPVKFWLGALSIFFDIIFMIQHYCLYKQRDFKDSENYTIHTDEEEVDE